MPGEFFIRSKFLKQSGSKVADSLKLRLPLLSKDERKISQPMRRSKKYSKLCSYIYMIKSFLLWEKKRHFLLHNMLSFTRHKLSLINREICRDLLIKLRKNLIQDWIKMREENSFPSMDVKRA